jgi:hypothetical protein
VLLFAVGWGVLGYFWHELAVAKEEYQRYDNAASVVETLYASDVVICGFLYCARLTGAAHPAGGGDVQRGPRMCCWARTCTCSAA